MGKMVQGQKKSPRSNVPGEVRLPSMLLERNGGEEGGWGVAMAAGVAATERMDGSNITREKT